jgi:hypothetical protein
MEMLDNFDGSRVEMRDDYDPVALAYLEQNGYAKLERVLSGHVGIIPTAAGRVELSRFKTRRDDRVERALNLRDMYLRYIWEEDELGKSPNPDAFVRTGPTWLGSAYSAGEVERAGEWLKEAGLIAGQAAWQYSGPLRPSLTIAGRDLVESGRSVTERPTPGGSAYNTTITGGNVNLAQGSNNVSQHQDNRSAADAALAIVDLVLARIDEVTPEQRPAVQADVEALRAEASGEGRGHVLRDLGTKVLTTVATGAAG